MQKRVTLLNVSSGPHVRSKLSTSSVMYNVILALVPSAIVGVYFHGLEAFLTILVTILSTVASEAIFDFIVKKPITIKDGSAVLTGLLLALCLPSCCPLYIPILGGVFAIVIVKCLFGGLGHNFMNPALAARCFLLISFGSLMTQYSLDGVTQATPLVKLAEGGRVDLLDMFIGNTSGVIGCSAAALLIGGIYLLLTGGITWEIPVSTLAAFTLFIALFSGKGFDFPYLLAQLRGGGIIMAAFFMATDPVTSPVTSAGQLIFGAVVGILSGLFRIMGSSADSVSYAVIISNLLVPFLDEYTVPKPFGFRAQKESTGFRIPKSAITLCFITLIAGVALSGVFGLTKDTIEEQKEAQNNESYRMVCQNAQDFQDDEAMASAIEALAGGVYGSDFGKAYINKAKVGLDASGNVAGYVISATSGDGFDGNITMSIGLDPEGTVTGIAFTELHETAGMGMRCDEEDFKNQFIGAAVDKFVINKEGSASADNEINSISGASVSSGAVINAVNAALDFFHANQG